MAYNKENYHRLSAAFAEKRAARRTAAEARMNSLHEKYPELGEIDRALSLTGMAVIRETAMGKEGLAERLEKLRRENKSLQQARADFLSAHGYPADYTDIVYDCEICRDEGFVDGKLCDCLRRALIGAGYESSGIGRLIAEQSFETFSLSYYKNDARAYAAAEQALTICRAFAEGDDVREGRNLLMIGPTGLGKTHLSTSVAKVLIDRGFDVVYDTAQNVFADFEAERFGGERFSRSFGEDGSEPSATDRYFDCDLLIVDDLGTEMVNHFTVACLYNLINTRLNHRRSVMINTNLAPEELRRCYSDRITSRLLGEYTILALTGQDVRQQKLRG